MMVFLRNIPGDTMRAEIEKFVMPAVRGGIFSAKGEIKSIQILKLRDTRINLYEYHALVRIEPEAVARRVIKKLHGQRFRDRRITVRQYYSRSSHNERRADLPNDSNAAAIKEKRSNPTRRRDLEIEEDFDIQYSSHKSFHRRY